MLGSTILKLTDPYETQVAVGRVGDFKRIVTGSGIYQSELAFVATRTTLACSKDEYRWPGSSRVPPKRTCACSPPW